MTSYVHKWFHFGCTARSCNNLIYAHHQTRFPKMKQSTYITQSYGKFVYRNQSHLAQTPHSRPDQLKVNVQKFHKRFSVLQWVVWHTCADVQRKLWLPSTEFRWKHQVPLNHSNSTASVPLFPLPLTAHFTTIMPTFCDWSWQITMSSLGFLNSPTTT
jgi:hypothetical protein